MESEQATQAAPVNTPSVSIQPVPEFNPDAEIGASLATKQLQSKSVHGYKNSIDSCYSTVQHRIQQQAFHPRNYCLTEPLKENCQSCTSETTWIDIRKHERER